MDSLSKSMEMTKGYRWQIFGLMVALFFLNVAGALALLVGLLVTVPVSVLAATHMYKVISGNVSEVAPQPAEEVSGE